jgi:hypothetical protein
LHQVCFYRGLRIGVYIIFLSPLQDFKGRLGLL